MTADQQQQLWVVLPLLLRTLAEEDADAMVDRAQAVLERDPELISRIVAGSARLELVDRLRVERTIEGQDAFATREWREIDQLTAFLAGSCVPIAQGTPDAPNDTPFQLLITSLPQWAQDWLGRNYLVLPTNADPEGSMKAWLQVETASKCRLIAAHLAAITRLYPVSVDYVPFDEHDRLHLTPQTRDAPFEFAWIHRVGDPTLVNEVGVGITSGLAEAEVLRFLLVTAFRQWLDCPDDATLIDRYWTRRNVRVWALRTLREIESNVQHIHAWAARSLHTRPEHADFAPIAGLDDAAARNLAADSSALTRFGGMEPETLNAYLGGIEQINERINELNQRVEKATYDLRGKAAEEEDLFVAVMTEPQTRALLEQIEQVHHRLTRVITAAL